MSAADLIHIGLHKTASTYLQRRVLPMWTSHSLVERQRPLYGALIAHVERAATADYLTSTIATAFAEIRAHGAPRRLVLSDEELGGQIFSGAHTARSARRCAEALPDARVVAIIREPQAHARSLWAQFIKDGGTLDAEAFLTMQDPSPLREERFLLDHLLLPWAEAFGGRLLVLPYELLRVDPTSFVAELQRFAGAERDSSIPPRERDNVSPSDRALTVLRLWNRSVRATPHNPSPSIRLPGARAATTALRRGLERLDGEHRSFALPLPHGVLAAGVRAVTPYCPVDLAEFGYPS